MGTLTVLTCRLSGSLTNSFYSVEHVCQRHMNRIELIISLLQRNPLLPPPFMPFHSLNAELPETTGDGSPDTFPTKYPEALTAGLERIRPQQLESWDGRGVRWRPRGRLLATGNRI
jgi:hypothetical protein